MDEFAFEQLMERLIDRGVCQDTELARERLLNEIRFNRLYWDGFRHGTDGHMLRVLVGVLVDLLEGK